MSNTLFLFDEEEFQPSSKRQRDAARKEIEAAKLRAAKEEKRTTTIDPKPIAAHVVEDPLQDWQSNKQYHSISEVAQLFQLNVSHIRHWTAEFKINVRKNKKGDRLYSEANIYELKKIYSLMKHEGMTIKGARAKIETDKHTLTRDQLRDTLLELKQQLQLLAQQLQVS